jgi:hypothetical protein
MSQRTTPARSRARKKAIKSRRERIQERIRRNCEVHPVSGCWLWTARINNQGYPTLSMRMPEKRATPFTLFAHRVSLEAFTRAPRDGEEAAHDPEKCPERRDCVNPDHLRWATRSENQLDNTRKRHLKIRELCPPLHGLELVE